MMDTVRRDKPGAPRKHTFEAAERPRDTPLVELFRRWISEQQCVFAQQT